MRIYMNASVVNSWDKQPHSLISDKDVQSLLPYWGKRYVCVRSRKFGMSWRLCWPPHTPYITSGGNSWLHSCFVFLQWMVNIHSVTVAAKFGLFCIINKFVPEIHTVASFKFFSEASDIGQGQILDYFGPAWKFFLVLLNKVTTFSLHIANSHIWSLENSMLAASTPKESEQAGTYNSTYTYRCVCT